MPAKSTWLLELPRIQQEVAELNAPVVDRSCFERLFGVRRRRAIQLMHAFGGYQAGRTFLIERQALLGQLQRLENTSTFEWERARKERLTEDLARTRKVLAGRQVKIKVVETAPSTLLPEGITLSPGELHVAFSGVEDLLQKLYQLGQAAASDFPAFADMVADHL